MLTLQVVANASNVYPLDTEASSAGVDDMTTLSYLHEPGVLYNLRCRYDLNEIYVSIYSMICIYLFSQSCHVHLVHMDSLFHIVSNHISQSISWISSFPTLPHVWKLHPLPPCMCALAHGETNEGALSAQLSAYCTNVEGEPSASEKIWTTLWNQNTCDTMVETISPKSFKL